MLAPDARLDYALCLSQSHLSPGGQLVGTWLFGRGASMCFRMWLILDRWILQMGWDGQRDRRGRQAAGLDRGWDLEAGGCDVCGACNVMRCCRHEWIGRWAVV